MSRGLFITFEGGEGSGKTTQINKLAERLTEEKLRVLTTREPGGTPEAEKIRDLLVQRGGGAWSPMAEILLLYAARVMHVEAVIKPALEEGKVVLCDRFTDSTLAYQGYGHGMDLGEIKELQTIVMGDFKPDLTVILDIDPGEGLQRSSRRLAAQELHVEQTEDRFENLNIEFHNRLREGFLSIARSDMGRCAIIDASMEPNDIAREIYEFVSGKLEA
ncbi:dTMP kinase [Alphaproteobacteria bacterium]|nr:dTMP kinase [Alphaproteobacteria bacterium]